jgi:hypothetical protein
VLVHLFDIIVLLVQHMLRFREQRLIDFGDFGFHVRGGQFVLAYGIGRFLAVDAGTGGGPLLENLLLLDLVVGLGLLFRNNSGSGSDTGKICSCDDCAHRILILLSFASDVADIGHVHDGCVVFLARFPVGFEERIVNERRFPLAGGGA